MQMYGFQILFKKVLKTSSSTHCKSVIMVVQDCQDCYSQWVIEVTYFQ